MFENVHWPAVAMVVLLALIVTFFILSRRMTKKSITFLSEEDFVSGMRKAQLIDLRKKNDFDQGHINGSRNISLAMLNKSLTKLRSDQPIYFICADEKLSKRATMLLVSKGYSNIYGLAGGLNSWSKPLKTKK